MTKKIYKKKVFSITAIVSFLGLFFATGAQAVTVDSVQDSDINDAGTRDQKYVFNVTDLDADNTYRVIHDWNAGNSSIVVVGKLEIATNGRITNFTSNQKNWTMAKDTILSGGTIGGNTKTVGDGPGSIEIRLGGNGLSLQGGTINATFAGIQTSTTGFINGSLTGSGTIDVTGNGIVQFASTITTTGFSGSFNVTGSTFDVDATDTNGSFGLSLSDSGVFDMDTNIVLSSLTIGGTNFDVGTYSYNDFSAAQQAFLVDNGGTIEVIPEPGTYALLAGCLALTSVMLRRRRS